MTIYLETTEPSAPSQPILEVVSVEREEVERAEYVNSLHRFAVIRADEVTFGHVMPEEDAAKLGFTLMRANHSLLESLSDVNTSTESTCTVTIPVALMKENPETVLATVEKIKRSRVDPDTTLDIVIWGNATYDNGEKLQVEEKASAVYERLIEGLQPLQSDTFRIQTAFQTLHTANFSMSKLRRDYMDAVAIDGLNRGYGFRHPVMWIDADTTHIAKGTVESLAQAIRNGEALFAHANTQFNADWAPKVPFAHLDDTTKAFVMHEMHRRQLQNLQAENQRFEYPEESGFVMSAGVYLNSGGVNVKDPIDESGNIVDAAKQIVQWMREGVAHYALIPYEIDSSGGVNTLCMRYVKSARLGTSARRHYEVTKQHGARGLIAVDNLSYGEPEFASRVASHQPSAPILKSDLEALFSMQQNHWTKRMTIVGEFNSDPGLNEFRDLPAPIQEKLDRCRKALSQVIDRHISE